ncbi:MAG: HipA N-terminal domain-containing protein [Acidimicrobiales bacterium]
MWSVPAAESCGIGGRPTHPGRSGPAASQRSYVFEYHPEWRARGIQISPLSMPTDRHKLHSFANLPVATYSHLPPVIADVLPDEFGRSVLHAYLSKEGVDLGRVTPLDRLAYLAGRGMVPSRATGCSSTPCRSTGSSSARPSTTSPTSLISSKFPVLRALSTTS